MKGRASKEDAVMAKAWPVSGHRCAGSNGLVDQTARRSLGEMPNLHCKPQCDRPASVRIMAQPDMEWAGRSRLSTIFPRLRAGRSET